MARTDTLTNFLTDVASAIKAKKGDETAIPAANFDTEIANLPSGGGDNSELISFIESTIENFEIPYGTTKIAEHKFYKCDKLTSITIPNSVTSIGGYAFYYCGKLTSVTIPDSVTSIGQYAFYSCGKLTSITIPNSVTSIGEYAYRGTAASVTSITVSLGNTVYHSTDNCLIKTESKILVLGCKNSIIPSDGSVTSIGSSAFFDCGGLTSITIPDSITSIGDRVFWSCSSLTRIVIPDSVESIGAYAFAYCQGLKEFDFSSCTDIPTLSSSSAFTGIPSSMVIKVPSALLNEWKSATNWSTYANKIVEV